jgi:uncharacterized protein (DUF1330 family)/membrane protease YdiL (CAAX protease family)
VPAAVGDCVGMTTYLVNHLRIPNGVPSPQGLEYLERVEGTFLPYEGEWLVLDAQVEVLEGARPGSVVLMEFPDMATAKKWYFSSEYQEIVHLRTDSTISDLILVDPVDAVVDHQTPDRHVLGVVYATTTALVFVPKTLTEPGLLPGGATPHGILENVLGSAVPAFIVTALVSGKAGVGDLARRSFGWRVPLRWYAISLLGPPLILLIAIAILYGLAPLRALAQNWVLLFTAFLPALAIMIVLNNVAEEIGWTGFVFARFQDRHGPLRAALVTTVFFWLFHVPSFYVETRSWATTALALGIFLLPHLGSRVITGWLYNSAGFSVLIAGLFHSMHNAIVNPTGLVAVVGLPQFEVLVIMAGIVVLAAAIIAIATRGRLGLKRSSAAGAAT